MPFWVYINVLDGATYWVDDENKIPKAISTNITMFEEDISEANRLRIKRNENNEIEFYLEPKENIFREEKVNFINHYERVFAERIKEIYPVEKQISDKNDFDMALFILKVELPLIEQKISQIFNLTKHQILSEEEINSFLCSDLDESFCETFAYEIGLIVKYVKRYSCLLRARKTFLEKKAEFLSKSEKEKEELIENIRIFEEEVEEILHMFLLTI